MQRIDFQQLSFFSQRPLLLLMAKLHVLLMSEDSIYLTKVGCYSTEKC